MLISKLHSELQKAAKQYSRWCLAVSGGSDSLALLRLVYNWRLKQIQSLEPKITVITIDHAQREESMHEAIFVSKAALECDFEIRVFKLPPASIIGNKQNTLRQARYKILTDYCHQFRNVCLFTAHHMDDQIETFLMRLGRGSGSKGLSSIPQYGHMFGIPIFRPLLLLRKSELKNYLSQCSTCWIEDKSNKDLHYRRNKVRSQISRLEPSFDKIFNGINCTTSTLRKESLALDHYTMLEYRRCVDLQKERVILNKEIFLSLPEAIGLRILEKIVNFLDTKTARRMKSSKLQNLYNLITTSELDHTIHQCLGLKVQILPQTLLITPII